MEIGIALAVIFFAVGLFLARRSFGPPFYRGLEELKSTKNPSADSLEAKNKAPKKAKSAKNKTAKKAKKKKKG